MESIPQTFRMQSIRTISLPLLTLLVGLAIGFFSDSLGFPKSSADQISQSELPVGISILKNPIVNQWVGSVEGTLVAKDSNSITLSNNGSTIKIQLRLNEGENVPMPKFFDNRSFTGPKTGEILLDDIQIGSRLRGSFFVMNQGDKEVVVASSFTLVNP